MITIYSNGQLSVPFGAYAGQNSGIAIEPLTTEQFRRKADALFGFSGSERQARTAPGWLTPERVGAVVDFGLEVAAAYADANQADVAVAAD